MKKIAQVLVVIAFCGALIVGGQVGSERYESEMRAQISQTLARERENQVMEALKEVSMIPPSEERNLAWTEIIAKGTLWHSCVNLAVSEQSSPNEDGARKAAHMYYNRQAELFDEYLMQYPWRANELIEKLDEAKSQRERMSEVNIFLMDYWAYHNRVTYQH